MAAISEENGLGARNRAVQSPEIIYVTGGGKCGTHLVSDYITRNWEGGVKCPKEFKSWREELTHEASAHDRFVFHCPDPDAPTFRRLSPNGLMLILLRHPVQHYVSWTTALHNWVTSSNGYIYPKTGQTIFQFALRRVVESFRCAGQADTVWRIEDFTRSRQDRHEMVSKLLGAAIRCADENGEGPAYGWQGRTAFGWLDGIRSISGAEYPGLLTGPEVDALAVHDDVFSAHYPAWRQAIECGQDSDIDILRERSTFSFGITLALQRRNQKAKLRSGQFRYLLPLIKGGFSRPVALAAKLDMETAKFVLGENIVAYSHMLKNRSATKP